MLTDTGLTTVQLRAWDRHEGYSLCANSALGIVQVLCGLLSMALGVGAICTWASGYYVAYGIWCGFVFTLTGGICIGAARHKNTCMITTNMTLCIFSAFCSAVQFSMGVLAAYLDSPPRRHDIIDGRVDLLDLNYDIYYHKNNDASYICSGRNVFISWHYAWGPVDVLLLVTAFIEAVVSITAAALCCKAVCCGYRRLTDTNGGYNGHNVGTVTTGYSQEGYTSDPRLSPVPPLYKIT